MLSQANLIGKVQSADAKCLANRRSLEVDDHPTRHGSQSSSIKLKHKSVEHLSTDRRPHVTKTYNKALDKGTSHWKHQPRINPAKDVSSIIHPKDPKRIAEPGIGMSSSTLQIQERSEGRISRSQKYITLGQLQTVQGQRNRNFTRYISLAHDQMTNHPDSSRGGSRSRGTETTLAKIWKKKKEARRIGGLLLLNGLAAIYGSGNVANIYVDEAGPALPASLTALVKFTSALVFFNPSLVSALKYRQTDLVRAGAELGALAFAASFVDSWNPVKSSSSSPLLLYAFTVIFVAFMEFFTGCQSGMKLTRVGTLAAAILGMGVLEEEGVGWKGIYWPQITDLWSVAVAVIFALHIFRSEALAEKLDPLRLIAVQCGVLAILSLGWEMWSTFDASALQSHVLDVKSIPWVPLVYNGVVCSGLCSWLELRGLRSVHASTATLVYTTIPVWGAFFSTFTSHDVPCDSAIISGLVIASTSIYAQFLSKDDDFKAKATSTAFPINSPNEKTKDNDYFPSGLLVSQLKFPYYAAQAKGLLAEIKFKLGILKYIGLICTGVSDSSKLPYSHSSMVSSSTAAATTTTGANNLTTSHIDAAASQTIDLSTSAVNILHGPNFTTSAMSAAHSASNVLAHLSVSIVAGLGSALVAVRSDIMLAVDEAEDVATVMEQLVQGGAESAVHVVAACLTAGGSVGVLNTVLTGSVPTLQVPANFLAGALNVAETLDTQVSTLGDPYNLTDVLVNEFSQFNHLISPLVENISI